MSSPVAAVVVTYRSNTVLPSCLDGLRGRVAEAVVVDNCPGARPPGELRERHRWVRWIDSRSNLGFAGGVNLGVAATTAPFVLLVNPDCELLTGVESLVEACSRRRTAAAGGRLVDTSGATQRGFVFRSLPSAVTLACEALGVNGFWPGNPVNRRYRQLDRSTVAACRVQQPAGALLMIRREVLARLQGLDEGFHPAWFEDVDLARRLQDAGYILRYEPSCVARHEGAHSVRTLPLPGRLEAWYGGMLRYAEKHFSPGAARWVRLSVVAGLQIRALRCVARNGPLADAAVLEGLADRVLRGFPDRTGVS